MEEVWRSVKDYEGLYEVSNWGRVRSLGMYTNVCGGGKRWLAGRVLKPGKHRNGYVTVNLCKNGVQVCFSVHRLVGMAFPDLVGWTEDAKGRPFEELQINHKNEVDKTDNRVENLEWCTAKYNMNYGTAIERKTKLQTNGKLAKTVYQCTPDGELVRVWPSTAECGRNGFSAGNVSLACLGVYRQYKGFIWSYNPPA